MSDVLREVVLIASTLTMGLMAGVSLEGAKISKMHL